MANQPLNETYQPKSVAAVQSLEDMRFWVEDELGAIASQFADTKVVELRPRGDAPLRPREGMLVYADGTGWDPGVGEGVYAYVNGAWALLGGNVIGNRTVATLPVAPPAGTTAWITDGAPALAWAAVVVGGGAVGYKVLWNGVAWKVMGT